MKKVILAILLITTHSILKAQTYAPVIDTCGYLQQFAGEWKYVIGTALYGYIYDTIGIILIFLVQMTFLIDCGAGMSTSKEILS